MQLMKEYCRWVTSLHNIHKTIRHCNALQLSSGVLYSQPSILSITIRNIDIFYILQTKICSHLFHDICLIASLLCTCWKYLQLLLDVVLASFLDHLFFHCSDLTVYYDHLHYSNHSDCWMLVYFLLCQARVYSLFSMVKLDMIICCWKRRPIEKNCYAV